MKKHAKRELLSLRVRIVAASLILFPVLSLYYGAYQPFMKARAITTLGQRMSSARTLEDVKVGFNDMLSTGSYVGREESTLVVLEYIKVLIRHFPRQSDAIDLATYGESLATREDDVREMLGVANIYGELWTVYPDYTKALAKREKWLLKVLTITPNSPQALYSLFDVYNAMGATEEKSQLARTILTYWPDETRLEAFRGLTKQSP